MYRADARKRKTGGIVVRGIGLALVLAFHAGGAAAQAGPRAGTEGRGVAGDATSLAVSAMHPAVASRSRMQDIELQSGSSDVRYVAQWVVDSGDNSAMPYIIIDKVNARVFVLDAHGHLQGAAPALLGLVVGDGTAAGIGDQKLSAIRPEERTTPAGRFVASLGRDLHGKDILWIDYASGLALHRVVKGTTSERRAQRLQSATSSDRRISYGCINVPVRFYETVVAPAFTHSSGVVYILPEMSPAREMFGSRDASLDSRVHDPAQPGAQAKHKP